MTPEERAVIEAVERLAETRCKYKIGHPVVLDAEISLFNAHATLRASRKPKVRFSWNMTTGLTWYDEHENPSDATMEHVARACQLLNEHGL